MRFFITAAGMVMGLAGTPALAAGDTAIQQAGTANWAMILLAFGFLGLFMRRRDANTGLD